MRPKYLPQYKEYEITYTEKFIILIKKRVELLKNRLEGKPVMRHPEGALRRKCLELVRQDRGMR